MKKDKKKTYHERFNAFYQSAEWKSLREARFGFADGLCEKCKEKGIVRAGREVHHRISIEEDWSKRLDFDNLVLLCPDCHNSEHERISPLQKFLKDWENI
ncbi:MAG: HNH endonuclease [Bacteroidales bacterium]|nr:HNH endonuclease [Bacteroidales bacterium]